MRLFSARNRQRHPFRNVFQGDVASGHKIAVVVGQKTDRNPTIDRRQLLLEELVTRFGHVVLLGKYDPAEIQRVVNHYQQSPRISVTVMVMKGDISANQLNELHQSLGDFDQRPSHWVFPLPSSTVNAETPHFATEGAT